MRSWLYQRLVPLTLAATSVLILATSAVSVNLVVVSGLGADLLLLAWASMLVLLALWPRSVLGHMITAPLTMAVLLGRAIGFVQLASERGSWALTGAVAERASLLVMVMLWHLSRVHIIGRTTE